MIDISTGFICEFCDALNKRGRFCGDCGKKDSSSLLAKYNNNYGSKPIRIWFFKDGSRKTTNEYINEYGLPKEIMERILSYRWQKENAKIMHSDILP